MVFKYGSNPPFQAAQVLHLASPIVEFSREIMGYDHRFR
jgi:hypothetical protein